MDFLNSFLLVLREFHITLNIPHPGSTHFQVLPYLLRLCSVPPTGKLEKNNKIR